jgi:16S rRNA (cytosine1402-N4)-methyltransferase
MMAAMGDDPAHHAVLLSAAVDALITAPEGRYFDGTFGRGGHSRHILKALSDSGQLIGIDKDPAAIAVGEALAKADGRFRIQHGSFARLEQFVRELGWQDATGVLLDLGVSSPQLDDAERGFSFMRNGPLDMRMDPGQSPSAAEWLNTAPEQEIANVIFRYGEERFSRRIARAIVARRVDEPLQTTWDLAQLVSSAVPRKEKHKHPATRTFQAVRVFINRELEDLETGLEVAARLLARGGRLVVISFHSLEDRIVKRFMRDLARGPQLPRGLPVTAEQQKTDFRLVGKAVKADDSEINENVRSRSAVMRVLERCEDEREGS